MFKRNKELVIVVMGKIGMPASDLNGVGLNEKSSLIPSDFNISLIICACKVIGRDVDPLYL